MPRRSYRSKNNGRRSGAGYQTAISAVPVGVYHNDVVWTPTASGGSEKSFGPPVTVLSVRPTSCHLKASSTGGSWLQVSARTGHTADALDVQLISTPILLGPDPQTIVLRAARGTDFKPFARWHLRTNGTCSVTGYVTFSAKDQPTSTVAGYEVC